MKKLAIAAVLAGIAVAGIGYWATPRGRQVAATDGKVEGINIQPEQTPSTPASALAAPVLRATASKPTRAEAVSTGLAALGRSAVRTKATTASAAEPQHLTLSESVDGLVSAEMKYEQKRAIWNELRESGKLDEAIQELEKRTAENPQSAVYPAVLGDAYLKKCAVIQDMRERGILALQADKLFDTALELDPANWEARFTKAVSLSYWPDSMNKGPEVIQHFERLVQQQEAQASQPQFAATYLWLGEQYQKAGRAEDAQNMWQQGASLYPENEALKKKLVGGN